MGKDVLSGVRGKGRKSRDEMQPNLINRNLLPPKHKQDWSITKKQLSSNTEVSLKI